MKLSNSTPHSFIFKILVFSVSASFWNTSIMFAPPFDVERRGNQSHCLIIHQRLLAGYGKANGWWHTSSNIHGQFWIIGQLWFSKINWNWNMLKLRVSIDSGLPIGSQGPQLRGGQGPKWGPIFIEKVKHKTLPNTENTVFFHFIFIEFNPSVS